MVAIVDMKRHRACLPLAILAVLAFSPHSHGMPPHPSLTDSASAARTGSVVTIPSTNDWHSRGICTPDDFGFRPRLSHATSAVAGSAAASFRILALLVHFSDKPAAVSSLFFDSLVFGISGATVHDYFDEISSAQIDLVTLNLPASVGWTNVPQTYAYYVNGQQGTGAYPQNSQKLVEDLVDLVDGVVNFANYDNDGDGDVDVLLVIHAGSGAELTTNATDIWSHKWAITPRAKDGVLVSSYTIQPEYWYTPGDMTIGVYAHELCHGFGLPDLYDTDGSSNGIGRWGIMATGSWNGPTGLGESPSYPSAWSRIQMGIATATNVSTNQIGQTLDAIETGGPIYRLWTAGAISSEYFLVENRQKTGYDSHLRGDGLLIWHIDDTKGTNEKEWYPSLPVTDHYLVGLEQADGSYELEHKVDLGDQADPFPGATNRTTFTTVSSPSSNAYAGHNSFVEIANISASSSSMTADLIVGVISGVNDGVSGLLPDSPELAQNYPNPFNPSTIIRMDLPRRGKVRLEVYNVLGQMVRILFDAFAGPGSTTVIWDGRDEQGSVVSSGIYFYRMITEEDEQTRKMVFIR